MITIVCGLPRTGKTAFLAADAYCNLDNRVESIDLRLNCCRAIRKLNANGMQFNYPDRPPVYTNFRMSVPIGYRTYNESYYIDGFHFGFDNPDVPVVHVPPGSKIYLSEAQRYYNSKERLVLPNWVSRAYEEHEHFDLDIMLDVQRAILIDANIRNVAGKIVEQHKLEIMRDRYGNISGCIFNYYEFDSWRAYERYSDSGAKTYEKKRMRYDMDVLSCYESKSYRAAFLPTKQQVFDYMLHDADLTVQNKMYAQIAPDGYWKGKGK